MQKIRIIGFFLNNGLHWQFEVRLLLFTVCTFRPRLIWSYVCHNTVLYPIRWPAISRQVGLIKLSTNLSEEPSRSG
jgi:hypothetical protein